MSGFLSRVVNRAIYQTLANDADVLAEIPATRIIRGRNYPEGTMLPAILFYMEAAAYDAGGSTVRAEHITSGEYRYVVQVDDKGRSDAAALRLAEAQFGALAGLQLDDFEDAYEVTFTAQGEVPFDSYFDGATPYQRLGTIYSVSVTQGAF